VLAGHYAASFAGEKASPGVPLWVFLVAAQLVDIVWGVLVLAGVEHASLDFSLPSNPLVAEHMPYSHSLLGTVVIAAIAANVVWLWRASRRDALVVALVVVSHWFLDLLMHRHDLTVAGSGPKLGLALWNHPLVAHTFELAVLAGAFLLFRRRDARWTTTLLAILVVVQLYAIFAPPPPSVTQMAGSLLVVWLGIPAVAAWMEARTARA
jgi:hypothetical protein